MWTDELICSECIDGFAPAITSLGYQCSSCTQSAWYGVPLFLVLEFVRPNNSVLSLCRCRSIQCYFSSHDQFCPVQPASSSSVYNIYIPHSCYWEWIWKQYDLLYQAGNLSLWNLEFGLLSLSDSPVLHFTWLETNSYLFALLHFSFLSTGFDRHHMGMHRTTFKEF